MGHTLLLSSEIGEYDSPEWNRIEIQGKVTTVDDLNSVLQQFVEGMGFNYLNVNLENKEDDNV